MSEPAIRRYVPPALRDLINLALGNMIRFRGPYPNWATALAATSGYDSDAILGRVADATERALRDSAVYEQDGTIKRAPPPPSDALAALLLAAAQDGGRLSVLDFGGGLASSFVRWRAMLSAIPILQWHVVEQAHFVETGKRMFANVPSVAFHASIESANSASPNASLLSGVLQYLPDPMSVLDAVAALDVRMIVIDRTPFADDGKMRVLTQHVPAQLGKASYPLWLLSRDAMRERLVARFDLLCEFEANDRPVRLDGTVARFVGCAWVRRDQEES